MGILQRSACLVPLLVYLGQVSPHNPNDVSTRQLGRIVRMSHEHGAYMRYVPRAAPAAILVIVHGTIGQDEPAIEVAKRFIQRWREVAQRHKLVLLAPAFDQENFGGHAGPGGGYRGLFGRHVGADEFIDAIVDATRQEFPSLSGRFYLYGHSAGGQLVSRYVVRHPERIEAAVISAAGTFAFPDSSVAWTNGMKPLRRQMRWKDDDPWQQIDIEPDPAGWVRAAQLPITVIVGALETGRVKAIPGNPGATHVERARLWVEAMNALAQQHGATGNVRLVKVDGVSHNSAQLTPACQRALWPE